MYEFEKISGKRQPSTRRKREMLRNWVSVENCLQKINFCLSTLKATTFLNKTVCSWRKNYWISLDGFKTFSWRGRQRTFVGGFVRFLLQLAWSGKIKCCVALSVRGVSMQAKLDKYFSGGCQEFLFYLDRLFFLHPPPTYNSLSFAFPSCNLYHEKFFSTFSISFFPPVLKINEKFLYSRNSSLPFCSFVWLIRLWDGSLCRNICSYSVD